MSLRYSKLGRKAISELVPGRALTERGITVERLGSGDLRYAVNVMVDGRRIHRVIGTESDGVTRTQCETFIEQARTDARAARLSLPSGRKLALTFAAAADDYTQRLAESGGKNLTIKRRHLRRNLKPYFGTMRLDTISSFTVDKYKKGRRDAGASNGTINRELATLSNLFRMALEWKWIERMPCRPKKLEESEGRIVALADAECDALLQAAVGSSDPYCYLFVAFGLNTAMRHSEILAARFDRLDLDKLRLFIPDAKAGQREQPITRELAAMLLKERESRDDPDGWIFPSPHGDSGSGHRARMDRAFADAAARAGFIAWEQDKRRRPPAALGDVAGSFTPVAWHATVTPHVMRHTAITALVKAGADLPTIKRISGHKTLRMVERYAHVHGDHIDRAIRMIGRALPEPGGNAVTQELHRPRLRAVR